MTPSWSSNYCKIVKVSVSSATIIILCASTIHKTQRLSGVVCWLKQEQLQCPFWIRSHRTSPLTSSTQPVITIKSSPRPTSSRIRVVVESRRDGSARSTTTTASITSIPAKVTPVRLPLANNPLLQRPHLNLLPQHNFLRAMRFKWHHNRQMAK